MPDRNIMIHERYASSGDTTTDYAQETSPPAVERENNHGYNENETSLHLKTGHNPPRLVTQLTPLQTRQETASDCFRLCDREAIIAKDRCRGQDEIGHHH
jgi:hypothetical protein